MLSKIAMSTAAESQVEYAIIGSGFSGICMGIKLLQAGYTNFRIYEKSGKILFIILELTDS